MMKDMKIPIPSTENKQFPFDALQGPLISIKIVSSIKFPLTLSLGIIYIADSVLDNKYNDLTFKCFFIILLRNSFCVCVM